jgi:anti-sigma28 factor (negative regulator of flagellin synthesis)
MEIRSTSAGNAERPRGDRSPDATDPNRSTRARVSPSVDELVEQRLAALRQTRSETPETAGGDRVEVSVAARALAESEEAGETVRRDAKVDELRAALMAGGLAKPERVEAAARRILGG